MQLGTLLLWLCMAATLAAIAAYVRSTAKRSNLPIARAFYYAMTTGVFMTSVYLMTLILNRRYDIGYVSGYSSRDLPLIYKVSAFWAGQEGSFLLWALLGAVIGVILSSKAKDYEPWLMAFWSTVQAFFFTLLLIKSPFVPTPQDLLARFPDGQGLNPLLQNFWMAIHPPMVFVGYAAMAAPAAFVVASLMKRDYGTWCNRCLPWVLFAWLTLGAGIILGSYWAYEVLGWGGYWAWDPVENASLVPWLAVTALLHGMLVERHRGSMRRTNMFLALLSFLLVVYATFLTRSGVLGDFSVHSFEGLGKGSNVYLIGFMLLFTVFCLGLLAWRGARVQSRSWYGRVVAKESAFFIGVISLSALALLVLIGTSSPLITKALGMKPDNVKVGYYGLVSSPVAVILLLLLSLAPLLKWSAREPSGAKQSAGLVIVAVVLGLALFAGAAVAMAVGPARAVSFGVGTMALVAFLVNGWFAARCLRAGWRAMGGYLAHSGVALMMIGMIFSPSSTQVKDSVRVILPQGDTVEKMGYRFTFLGIESVRSGKDIIRLRVERDGVEFVAEPAMRLTNSGVMHTPHIYKTLLRDLYIAPQDIRTTQIEPTLQPTPQGRAYGDATTPDGGAAVRLTGMRIDQQARVAILEVRLPNHPPIKLEMLKGQTKRMGKYTLGFRGFQIHGQHGMGGGDMSVGALLDVHYPGARTAAVLDVSVKRLISLIWIGSLLALIGGAIAIVRRSGENRRLLSASPPEGGLSPADS